MTWRLQNMQNVFTERVYLACKISPGVPNVQAGVCKMCKMCKMPLLFQPDIVTLLTHQQCASAVCNSLQQVDMFLFQHWIIVVRSKGHLVKPESPLQFQLLPVSRTPLPTPLYLTPGNISASLYLHAMYSSEVSDH